ncbi:Spt5-like transcription initiation protein [Hamiltosporidium tvaerminnensis]|uniref:Chromatin elongation factor SPT5 n=1 Tax=Hamiltosporidium tvaerminnensis TaxID=1176355 RepID=A0A4Q9KUP5_9MICR|nr:transcription elongation factor spt5 [Hamiltosporidium tvaerminnensis]TBT98284.1 Spt5-like transcription initiation protein [Hamiltosporidium tvaerminnensis]
MPKNKHSEFIDIEAEESSSSSYESTYSTPSSPVATRDWTHFTDQLIKKYQDVDEELEEGEVEEEYVESEMAQQNLLPTKTSPKLWVIKVKPHKEKRILQQLMVKFANSPILSLFCRDNLPGYIYIESYSKQHIQEHIRARITLVPLEEMVDALSTATDENVVFKSGMYVRIGKGKYKNDIGQVIGVQGPGRTKLRLVPRLPTKKMFEPTEFPNEVFKTKDYFIYKKEIYKNGFLEKVFDSTQLTIIEPSFSEMSMFCENGIMSGERIRVLEGEMTNSVGIVESVSGQELFIRTINNNQTDKNYLKRNSNNLIQVHSSFVKRDFLEGDLVVFEQTPGVILNVTNSTAVVAFNNFTEQKSVKIDFLRLANTVPTIIKNSSVPRQRLKRDPFLYKEVLLQEGEFKGYKGVVKDCYGDTFRVQLNSNLKYVNIGRDKVQKVGGFEGSKNYIFNEKYGGTPGYKTPGHMYGQTPGYKTPGHRYKEKFGETPGYKTPSHRYKDKFGETPGYSTSNKYTGETPGYSTTNKSLGSQTPGYSNKFSNQENNYKGIILKTDDGFDVVEKLYKSTYFTRNGKEFDISDVEYAPPVVFDRCCVVETNEKGIVLSMKGDVCIVRFGNGSVKEVSVDKLAKSE